MRAAWVGDGVNKGGGVFDPRGYGAEGDGVADDEPAITLAAAAAAGNTLEFKAGSYRIGSNVSLDETVLFHKGASLSIDGGVTVTFAGQLVAGEYSIFSGAGDVSLAAGSCKYVVPQWWGAVGDDSTDCHDAIEAAIAAMSNIGKMVIPSGTYQFDSPIDNFPYASYASVSAGYIIQGAGMSDTILKYTGLTDYGIKFWNPDLDTVALSRGTHYITLRDVQIEANALTSAGGGLLLRGASHCLVERVAFANIDGTYGTAIKLERRDYIQTEDSMVNDTDLDFGTTGGGTNEAYAIAFTTPASFSSVVNKVTVRLGKTGAPAGTITASIYSDSTGPSAIIGTASDAVTANTLSGAVDGADQDFVFGWDSARELGASTKYWIVLETSGYTHGAAEIRLRAESAGGGANAMADYDAAWNLTTDGSNNVVTSGRVISLYNEFRSVKIVDPTRAAVGYQIDDDSGAHIVDNLIFANSGILAPDRPWLHVVRTQVDRGGTGQPVNIGGGETLWESCWLEGATDTYPHYFGTGLLQRPHVFVGCHVSGSFANELGADLRFEGCYGPLFITDDPSIIPDGDQFDIILPDDPNIWHSNTVVGADTDAEAGRAIEFDANGDRMRLLFTNVADWWFGFLPRGTYLVTVWAKDTNQISNDFSIRSGHYTSLYGDPLFLYDRTLTLTADYKPYTILHVINTEQVALKTHIQMDKLRVNVNTISVSHVAIERVTTDTYGNLDTFSINTTAGNADGAREMKHQFIARRYSDENLTELDFATHLNWDVVGDFDDTAGNAVYSHVAGSGTLTQTNGNKAISNISRHWYEFTYTVSGFAGDPTAQITTTSSLVATSLTLTDGTHTVKFGSADGGTASFVISGASDSGDDTFTLDDVSLKEIGKQHILAEIKVSHDGSSANEKGKWEIKANDGDDGFVPTLGMSGDSAGNITIDGDLSLTDDDITNVGDIAVDSISADSGAGLGNRIAAPNPIMVYIPGGYYREADDMWQYKGVGAAADRYTVQSPSRLLLDVDDVMYLISAQADYVLSAAGSWDTTAGTDYTVAANRAGVDFYIYACQPGSGSTPVILMSDNSSAPVGYTTADSRRVGGFHCLCVAVGVIGGHPLTNFVAGDILPDSVWDYDHRPACKPEGMVYSEAASIWVDIYLASGTGGATASAYGGTISDTRDWMDFVDDGAAVNKRLLWDPEFQTIAAGSNEETNIAGGADPVTTGGHSDTAGRRMISDIGVEDACGAMWQWLVDQSYRYDAGDHTHTTNIIHKGGGATGSDVFKDQAETDFNANLGSGADETVNTSSVDPAPGWAYQDLAGAKGSLYRQGTYGDVKLRAGGYWNNGTDAGSRARNAYNYRWNTDTGLGGRFASEPR